MEAETSPKCRNVAVGIRVGCDYRDPPEHQPWIHAPHRGTVLAVDDPRAWENSIAFPGRRPARREVRGHLEVIARETWRGPISKVPVLWDFGRVFWEDPAQLYRSRPVDKTQAAIGERVG